jgi:hypothetical protein
MRQILHALVIAASATSITACTFDGVDEQDTATDQGSSIEPALEEAEQQSLSEVIANTEFKIPPAKVKAMEEAVREGVDGQPVPQHARCGISGPNLDHAIHFDAPFSGAANQRNGTIALSPTNCPILGALQPTDDAEYFCWTRGDDGFTWTFLRSLRSNVHGWVRDNLLDAFGAQANCGF